MDRLEQYLKDTYGKVAGVAVTVNNGAVPGTTSAYMAACVNLHVPRDADIVIIEYSVNDDWEVYPPMDNPVRWGGWGYGGGGGGGCWGWGRVGGSWGWGRDGRQTARVHRQGANERRLCASADGQRLWAPEHLLCLRMVRVVRVGVDAR